MSEIQIPYGSSAFPLHFDFPAEWDDRLISAVTLTISDRDGDVLTAAAGLTLYTQTTIKTATTRYDQSITLATGADDLAIGDVIRLYGTEGSEVRRVKGEDTTNEIYELEQILDLEYAVGDKVYGRFGNITIDVSTVATFTAGMMVVLTWTPTGDGQPVTQMAQVSNVALDIPGLRGALKDEFPRAYDVFTKPVDKFDRMAKIAESLVAGSQRINGLDIQRVVDQDLVKSTICAQMALLWTQNGDDKMEYERRVVSSIYSDRMAILKNSPIWTDDDMDGAEDEDEVTSHEHVFERGW